MTYSNNEHLPYILNRIYSYIRILYILLYANGRNLENKNIFSHYIFLFYTPVKLYRLSYIRAHFVF